MAARALLVYAVCRPPRAPLASTGMAGERLALCRVARVAAVVAERTRPPPPTVAALRRYDAAVSALARELPALLPARFGTCVASVEELAFLLRAREASLRRGLREVRGRVQMTLRTVAAERARAPAPAPGPTRRDAGRAYLQARAAQARSEAEVPALAPVLAAVARWVRAQRVVRSGPVASVYHLIPRGSVAAYTSAAQRAADDAGVRMVLSGPFAAYAFGGDW